MGVSRPRRFKSSKSAVHLKEYQLGGFGKESKSSSAHLSSNLAANQEALAPKSQQSGSSSVCHLKSSPDGSQLIGSSLEVAVGWSVGEKVSEPGHVVIGSVVDKVFTLVLSGKSVAESVSAPVPFVIGRVAEEISTSVPSGKSVAEKISSPVPFEKSARVDQLPSWTSFRQNQAVRNFLCYLVSVKIFSLSGVKRAMHMYLMETRSIQMPLGILKPNGLHVRELFDPKMCQSGKEKLDLSRQPLSVEAADRHHIYACELCGVEKSIQAECYFSKLRLCLTHGWRPLIDRDNVREEYRVSGNYLSVDQFQITASKEFNKMCDSGALLPVVEGTVGIVTPLGALIKGSDKLKTKVLTGISIVDQASLTQANVRLVDLGYPAIKARLTTDVTATGVNRAAYVPPFRYPSLADGIRIVTPNCFLAKADVARYFLMFPLSTCSYYLFLVRWLGVLFGYVRCMFGLASCPYYCSIWSAEFRSWVLSHGIPCSHMMDDWLTCGATREEAKKNLYALMAIMISIGLSFGADKEEISQQVVFLGVLLNTVTMKMSFERTGAQAFLVQLIGCQAVLLKGGLLSSTQTRSIAGKLNWYAEVLQSGRLHIRSWWCLLRFGKNLNSKIRRQLLEDTEWWIRIIGKWASGVESNLEYPILSASVLLSDPLSIYVVQSDISGEDGLGYLHGYLNDDNPAFLSRTWSQFRSSVSPDIESFSPESMLYSTSHDSELKGLAHFLWNTKISNVMLLWVTDSLSGAWSVNKGRCKEEAGLLTLAYIYARADELKILLVALWVPRDLNQTADYLSHLSAYLHRSEVNGCLRDLSSPEFCPDTSASRLGDTVAEIGVSGDSSVAEEACSGDCEQSKRVCRLVHPRGYPIEPSLLPQRSGIFSESCSSLPRVNTFGGPLHQRDQARKSPVRSVAQPSGRKGSQDTDQRASVRRHVSWSREKTPPPFSSAQDDSVKR